DHACKVLDLAPDAKGATCDLHLERGKTLKVNVLDPDGKPLSGAVVSGMTAGWPTAFPLAGGSCTVYALDAKRPRKLIFYHPERKLGAALVVRGDEKGEIS